MTSHQNKNICYIYAKDYIMYGLIWLSLIFAYCLSVIINKTTFHFQMSHYMVNKLYGHFTNIYQQFVFQNV